MRIHKAWYGPKGGHALLHCTEPTLQAVFRQAAWLTDLPGTAPAGLGALLSHRHTAGLFRARAYAPESGFG
jgi:hypothetical protein